MVVEGCRGPAGGTQTGTLAFGSPVADKQDLTRSFAPRAMGVRASAGTGLQVQAMRLDFSCPFIPQTIKMFQGSLLSGYAQLYPVVQS